MAADDLSGTVSTTLRSVSRLIQKYSSLDGPLLIRARWQSHGVIVLFLLLVFSSLLRGRSSAGPRSRRAG